MTAPIEEHVVAIALRNDHGQTVGLTTGKNVGHIAGSEVGIVVVNICRKNTAAHGSAAKQVGAIRTGAHNARFGILLVTGHLLVDDKDYMVVRESATAQRLVDAEHIGLMTIVDKAL